MMTQGHQLHTFSSLTMLSSHANKPRFSQSVLKRLKLWAQFSGVFTPVLLCLISVTKLCTVKREKTVPPIVLSSNRWISPAFHLIILPNVLIFEGIRKRVNFEGLPSTWNAGYRFVTRRNIIFYSVKIS